MAERHRVGPWLRRYGREEVTTGERRKELALAAGVGVVGLGALVGLVWLFIRAPVIVLGSLVAIWAVGFVVFVFIRRRASLRDQLIREGHAFHEIRKAMKEMETDGER